MKIESNIKEILSEWTFEGNKYFLPKVQLDRKDYVKCNDVLESIGMKWNRGQKAHIWDGDDLEETFRWILETGEVETLKEYRDKFQFFPTPAVLADYLVELSDIHTGNSILEPSAGRWSILEAIYRIEDFDKYSLDMFAIELEPNNAQHITEKYPFTAVHLWNFLSYKMRWFDRIIMNPPFSKSQDAKHIIHAYSLLKDGGVLVSVASSII